MERAPGAFKDNGGRTPPQIDLQGAINKPGEQIKLGFTDKRAHREVLEGGWRSPLFSEKFTDSSENFLKRLRVFAVAFNEKVILEELKDMGFTGVLGENGFNIYHDDSGKQIIEIPGPDGSIINTKTGIKKQDNEYPYNQAA